MNYFFSDPSGLKPFHDLGRELGKVGRIPELLPSVERGVYAFAGRAAAPDAKVGADVLPWWPSTGVYLLVEHGTAPAAPLVDVDGVAGAWWAPTATGVPEEYTLAQPGDQLTYLFLDDDPVAVAGRLRPVLDARWADGEVTGLFAAPFFVAHAHDLSRHLP
jgi:hypothetical protein